MNWHETIEYIRSNKEYKDLVRDSYLEADLELNIKEFGISEEFKETLKYINKYHPNCKTILDIGSGNGISALNFALKGYEVHAVEPDPSSTVGALAISTLKEKFQLTNLHVYEGFAEDLNFKDESFDLVYVRQAMHHAYDLNKFVKEAGRVLKKGGIFFSIRDHVILNENDKQWFLNSHPLQKFYGGENAFTSKEYRQVIKNANLTLLEELKYYDSIINYSPKSTEAIEELPNQINTHLRNEFQSKLGYFANIPFLFQLYKIKNGYIRKKDYFNENKIPGRIYSYISRKV